MSPRLNLPRGGWAKESRILRQRGSARPGGASAGRPGTKGRRGAA